MDPVFTTLTTATLVAGAEVSFGSVASLSNRWDVWVNTQNVPPGAQIEARLYGEGPSGQKILMGQVGVAPVQKRFVAGALLAARETFKFPQSLLGVAGFQADATRTGSVDWELRLVALTADAAVSVSAILAGYSFSEPFGNDSIQSAATIIPSGSSATLATIAHQSEFHDIGANFASVGSEMRFELIARAGTGLGTLQASIATLDCPVGFAAGKAVTILQGQQGVGADTYLLVARNTGIQTVTVTAVLDGYDSIGAAGGGGGAINLTQPTWFVNATSGSDANDGTTAGTAIQTLEELTQNRWGAGAVLEPTGGTVTVFLDSDIPATDPLNLDVVLGEDVSLVFRGNTFTTVFAGALTAATAVNRPANQAATVTDALAPWGVNTAQRIRNTTVGARLDSIGGIAADLGAGVARISRPWQTLFVGGVPVFLTPGSFLALDTYVIETLPRMTISYVKIAGYAGISGTQVPALDFVDLDLEVDVNAIAPFTMAAGTLLQAFACRLPNVEVSGGQATNFFNDIFKDSLVRITESGGAAFFGGLALNPNGFFAAGGATTSVIMSLDFTVQGSFFQLFGFMILDDVGVFDSPTNGIATNGTVQFALGEAIPLLGGGALYGAGNANVGYHSGTNTTLIYANAALLTITGAAGDFECGAVGVLDTPDPASWNFTGAIAQTWANLAAARAAGFGGTVINPSNLARILPRVA